MKTLTVKKDPVTQAITAALKRASIQALRRARAYGTEAYIAVPVVKSPAGLIKNRSGHKNERSENLKHA